MPQATWIRCSWAVASGIGPCGQRASLSKLMERMSLPMNNAARGRLTTATFEWDTKLVADGRYQVKVVASDARTNPKGHGRESWRVSDPVTIDNTAPLMRVSIGRQGRNVGDAAHRSGVQHLVYGSAGTGVSPCPGKS